MIFLLKENIPAHANSPPSDGRDVPSPPALRFSVMSAGFGWAMALQPLPFLSKPCPATLQALTSGRDRLYSRADAMLRAKRRCRCPQRCLYTNIQVSAFVKRAPVPAPERLSRPAPHPAVLRGFRWRFT